MTSGKYPHPISDRTVTICEMIGAHGPIGVGKLVDQIGGISRQDMSNICLRALKEGLLTVTKGTGSEQSHNRYSTVAGWREIVAERAHYEKKPVVRAKKYQRLYDPGVAVPVSEQMIEICEVLEEIGDATCTAIADNIDGLSPQQISKCCAYWSGQGLVVKVGMDWRSQVFRVAENWRKIVKEREVGYRLPDPPPTRWTGVNSVFSMGV